MRTRTATALKQCGLPLVVVALAVAGCSSSGSGATGPSSGGKIQVVAAENFWGSIASQVGGEHVPVTSIISSPDTDPHDYEPTTNDGRTIALAPNVVFNGVRYDAWAGQAIDANP